jgi:hypothetical protein
MGGFDNIFGQYCAPPLLREVTVSPSTFGKHRNNHESFFVLEGQMLILCKIVPVLYLDSILAGNKIFAQLQYSINR